MADRREFEIDGKPLSSLRVVDLKQELEKRGLSKSGSKKDLVDRLKMQLKLERLHESATTDEGHVPNLKLQDEIAEPNEFIKEYLAKQQKIYEIQKEARRRVELEEQQVRESSEASAGDTSQEEEDVEHPASSSEPRATDTLVGESSTLGRDFAETVSSVDRKDGEEKPSEDTKMSAVDDVEPSSEPPPEAESESLASGEQEVESTVAELQSETTQEIESSGVSLPTESPPLKSDCEVVDVRSPGPEARTAGIRSYMTEIDAGSSGFATLFPAADVPSESVESAIAVASISAGHDGVPQFVTEASSPLAKQDSPQAARHNDEGESPVPRAHESEATAIDLSEPEANKETENVDGDEIKGGSVSTASQEDKVETGICKTAVDTREQDATEDNVHREETSHEEVTVDTSSAVAVATEAGRSGIVDTGAADVAKPGRLRINRTRRWNRVPVPAEDPSEVPLDYTVGGSYRMEPAVKPEEEHRQSTEAAVVVVFHQEDVVTEDRDSRAELKDGSECTEAMPDAVKKDIADDARHGRRSVSPKGRDGDKVSRSRSLSASSVEERSSRQRERRSSVSSRSSSSSSGSGSRSSSRDSSRSSVSDSRSPSPPRRVRATKEVVDYSCEKSSSNVDSSKGRSSPSRNVAVKDDMDTVTVEVEEGIALDPLTPPEEEALPSEMRPTNDNGPDQKDERNGTVPVEVHTKTGARKISISTSKERRDEGNERNGGQDKPQKRRKWGGGSSSAVSVKRASVSISTDSLKGLIPDVKATVTPLAAFENDFEEAPVPSDALARRRESEDDSGNVNSAKPDTVNYRRLSQTTKDQEKMPEMLIAEDVKANVSLVRGIPPRAPVMAPWVDEPIEGRRSPSPARNPPTCIVHIRNLVRPFTLNQLKELLAQTGSLVETGFWIDKIKSKCYAMYETEDQAVNTRTILHNIQWPSSNPKRLAVDYATLDELDFHRNLMDPMEIPRPVAASGGADDRLAVKPARVRDAAPAQPPDKDRRRSLRDEQQEPDMKRSKRDRRSVERDVVDFGRHLVQQQPVREWDRDKIGEKSPGERVRAARSDGRRERTTLLKERSPRQFGEERMRGLKERERHSKSDARDKRDRRERRKEEEEAPAKLLDDLFRKTKTTPCIYWLPLTGDQIKTREEERQQRQVEREKRRQQMDTAEKDRVGGVNADQNLRRNRERDDSRSRRRSHSLGRVRNRRH